MTKALILVADGSEEIEFVTPYDGMYGVMVVRCRQQVTEDRAGLGR